MHTRNRKSMGIKVLNLLAAGLMVAALVLGCNTNVSNGGEVQPEKFTVTFNVNGGNGKLTANPVIPARGKVAKDAEITFTATANPGYRVDTWTVTPTEALIADWQAGNRTAKVKVTENTTVIVRFEPIVYTPVSYDNLSDHLTKTQPASDGIYCIEVTNLTESDVKGNIFSDSVSPLGQKLNNNRRKKVALKFGTISYGVTDMKNCFYGCTNLVQVSNIPDSITDMYGCFRGCTKLEQVPELPDGVTNMEWCFRGCTNLVQVPNIPNSVTNMYGCFRGCTKLEHVPNIPNSVTNMNLCFRGCTSLTSVPNIPNSVKGMDSCFYGCKSLTSVPNIPNSVKDMSWCFVGCTSLTSVTLKCGYCDGKFNTAFSGCRSLSAGSIKVPADSLDDYKDNANKMSAKAEWFAKDE